MLYGRFTRTMPYHKKVNAVAVEKYPLPLDKDKAMLYNIN